MPWPDSILVFLLCLIPANVLAVILHEAGHVIAARCAGLPVLAWGVGMRKPWFSFPLFGSIFYFARPITSGLTIYVKPFFRNEPKRDFFVIAGGPLATVFGFVAGLAIRWIGVRSDLLVTWIAVSALLTAASAIPVVIHSKGICLATDVYQLIHILRFGRMYAYLRLGHALSSSRAIVDLLQYIGCKRGVAIYSLSTAVTEAIYGNLSAARECLARVDATDFDDDLCRYMLYTQTFLEIKESPEDLSEIIETSRQRLGNDAAATFWIDCLEAGELIEKGTDAKAQLEDLRNRANAMQRPDLLYMVDHLECQTESSDEIEPKCRQFLDRYSTRLSTFDKAQLLAIATERLATAGNIPRARALFAEAQAAIADEASTIDSPETREAYLRIAAAPLQRAVAATADNLPIFIAEPVKIKIVRSPIYAYSTLLAGCVAFIASVVASSIPVEWILDDSYYMDLSTRAEASFAVGILLTLFFTLISILRHERWHRPVSIGLVLTGIALVLMLAVN